MSISNNDFLVGMMRFAYSQESSDEIINHILEYICSAFQSDRAYVFEDNGEGTYINTYEYCREGVEELINQNQNIQYEGMMDIWFRQYEKKKNIIIDDIEKYRSVSELWYNILKNQGVKTLVTGPITVKGKIVGLYGVDNPPQDILEGISDKIAVMQFVIDMMIRLRNKSRAVEESSRTDFLTGCKNRKGLEWAYDNCFDDEESVSVIMCDLNGLKRINDLKGHIAGDEYICSASDMLKKYFGKQNVYRLGGDEFAVVLLSEPQSDIEKKIEEFLKESKENSVAISLGYEYADAKGADFERMLHNADVKMYEAKRKYYSVGGHDRRN